MNVISLILFSQTPSFKRVPPTKNGSTVLPHQHSQLCLMWTNIDSFEASQVIISCSLLLFLVPIIAGFCADATTCLESCDKLIRQSKDLNESFFQFESIIPITIR